MQRLLTVLLAAATAGTLAFSDPIPVAETTIPIPPALVGVGDALHLFWLTRPPSAPPDTGEVWHAATSARGALLVAPHRIARGADTRLSWPAAARAGPVLIVAWMGREAEFVRLKVAVLDPDGTVRRITTPAPPAEEGGRIAILDYRGRTHLAWSQFSAGTRRVWYVRLRSDASADIEARPLVDGDAPALAGGEVLTLLWWSPRGGGNYTLVRVDLEDGGVDRVGDLTGQILLASPIPAIPLVATGGLDILMPTAERAFRTAGRLYLVRVRGPGVTARLPMSANRVLADVTAAAEGEQAAVFWVEAAGRRQNSEIFAATYERGSGRLSGVTRVTYTQPGSLRPSASRAGGVPIVAWLETQDIARFRLVLATSGARPRRFLLGTPELDLRRPGTLLAFSASVILSVLPYAALFASAFGLTAAALFLVAGAVLGGFGWWQALWDRPAWRLLIFLTITLAIELPARGVIPGQPWAGFLAVAWALPAVAAVAVTTARRSVAGMTLLVAAAGALLIQMLVVLFPWGVRQLTQF